MRKLLVIPLIVLLLCGCGRQTMLETVTDEQVEPVVAAVQRVQLHLPPELSAPALQSEENGALYLCDDYSVTVQTLQSGDLIKTIRTATGLNKENLQIQTTRQGNVKRHQFMWTANGEQGIEVGRTCILDDGVYHYVLTTLAVEEKAGQVQETWREMFASFCLATEREPVSTGS